MKFKRLSKNNDAVETVIAVILMVAITVILAAAIGATVFSQGPDQPAPQAKLEITPVSAYNTTGSAVVKFAHNGGNSINFDKDTTRVTASINKGDSFDITATSLGTMEPGSSKNLIIANNEGRNMTSGSTVNFKVVDLKSNQLICNTNVHF